MSFRDIGAGVRAYGPGKTDVKPKADEGSAPEQEIKAKIERLQDLLRDTAAHVDYPQRRSIPTRQARHLADRALSDGRLLAEEIEQDFRSWRVQLTGEPSERHKKKFSYEKLHKAFQEERARAKDLESHAAAAKEEAFAAISRARPEVECQSVCDDETSVAEDDVEETASLLGRPREVHTQLQQHADNIINRRVTQERDDGIRRIQNQVTEVHQMFRDLASIANEQGQVFATIEQEASDAAVNASQAVKEVRKASERQRLQRERTCCMLVALVLVLGLVLLPHMHPLVIHRLDLVPPESWGMMRHTAQREPAQPQARSTSSWGLEESAPIVAVAGGERQLSGHVYAQALASGKVKQGAAKNGKAGEAVVRSTQGGI
mmetsp:Transcript_2079/g.3503  ORF Transcript_2079/g.3503 Transcript_2079/m.3503 type:complete len:376 (-) Transcript_2079:159-1286(-)